MTEVGTLAVALGTKAPWSWSQRAWEEEAWKHFLPGAWLQRSRETGRNKDGQCGRGRTPTGPAGRRGEQGGRLGAERGCDPERQKPGLSAMGRGAGGQLAERKVVRGGAFCASTAVRGGVRPRVSPGCQCLRLGEVTLHRNAGAFRLSEQCHQAAGVWERLTSG